MFDTADNQLRIPGHIQKDYPTDRSPSPVTFELNQNGDLRTVRTLKSYLGLREDNSDALFPSRKSPRMTGKGINDVVKWFAERAEVRPTLTISRGDAGDVSAHTLLHSVAYRMLRVEDGHTFYDVRNRLRHRSIQTTERNYDHFDTI